MGESNSPLMEHWWTDFQKLLVNDRSRIWIKKKFTAVAGYWVFKDGYKILGKAPLEKEFLQQGAVLDEHAWEHEHCELCWQTISENEIHQPEGYTDGKEWLCCECYGMYIVPQKSI